MINHQLDVYSYDKTDKGLYDDLLNIALYY
ncbi:hypothetical protein SSIM_11830 [Staphylococcus simulans UMC-CNS-990]|uniref:Uncharacterized protein n=1 Tax=Staphylococcus simulans UMC-CNS-990 TaxID=1405498 RepID=A0ABN0PA20_STASI|nr:hypothetical protein SSIM_11830 [Staphylococcus simulans UMC-CNS-990]